jgi:hypothetical protein
VSGIREGGRVRGDENPGASFVRADGTAERMISGLIRIWWGADTGTGALSQRVVARAQSRPRSSVATPRLAYAETGEPLADNLEKSARRRRLLLTRLEACMSRRSLVADGEARASAPRPQNAFVSG